MCSSLLSPPLLGERDPYHDTIPNIIFFDAQRVERKKERKAMGRGEL